MNIVHLPTSIDLSNKFTSIYLRPIYFVLCISLFEILKKKYLISYNCRIYLICMRNVFLFILFIIHL